MYRSTSGMHHPGMGVNCQTPKIGSSGGAIMEMVIISGSKGKNPRCFDILALLLAEPPNGISISISLKLEIESCQSW